MKKLLLVAFILALGMIWIDKTSNQNLTNTSGKQMASYPGLTGNLPKGLSFGTAAPLQVNGTTSQNTGLKIIGGPGYLSVGPTSGAGGKVIPQSSSGGGGGGGGSTAAQVAAAAQQAKIDQALASGQDSQLQTGLQSASAAGANYQGQAGQLYGQLAQGQNTIDEARKNIGINQISSIKDLMNSIRQGLRGTGVQLASTNALDSSASGAAARIYANHGNVETNKINNAASVANEGQDVAQTNLGIQRDVGLAGLRAFRDNAVATITTEAQKGLDALKQYISIIGGDGNSVNADGIKQQILNEAQNKLGAVDQYIQGTVQGVHAVNPEELAAQAYKASNAGVVPSGPGLPFQLGEPAQSPQAQLGGADTSLIPLTLKSKVRS